VSDRSTNSADYQFVPRIVTALSKDFGHGAVVAAHSHPRAQLVYATQGIMRVQTPRSFWTIPPQRALWVPPGVVHEISMTSQVAMRTVYIEPQASTAFGPVCRVISVSRLLRELILSLAAEPVEYSRDGRGGHMAALIMSEIANAPSVPVEIPWPSDRRLIAICEAILENPGSARTIQHWADMVGASARTLIRLFSRETGLSYRQWVQQVHLADALSRLGHGEPIGRIASALGYASASAFTAMFRRALGTPPQRYFESG
jgi:AraC-like DNA-binding protein